MVNDQVAMPVRTVCHGCRGAAYANLPNRIGVVVMRPVLIAGDGEVIESITAQHGGDETVGRPCPDCGDTDDPGWLPGFVTPV